jgi:hypothetical protein
MEEEKIRRPISNFNVLLQQIKKIKKLKLKDEREKIKDTIISFTEPQTEGYIYCIYNNLYNVYEEPIYKLGNTNEVERRLHEYDNMYVEKSILKKSLKVPHKMLFEFFIMCNLCKYRLEFGREFFTNYEEIKKEFNILEEMLKNETLDKIIDHYLDKFISNETLKLIFNVKEYEMESEEMIYNYIQKELDMCNKYNGGIKDIKLKNKNIIEYKSKLLKSDKINDGYIINLGILPIKEYYDNKISILLCKKNTNLSTIKTYFLENIKIINNVRVRYLDLATYIINDLIGIKKINSIYYNCKNPIISRVIDIIKYYFKTYKNKKDIFYAYVKDRYNKEYANIVIEKNKEAYSLIYKRLLKDDDDLSFNINEEIKYIDDAISIVEEKILIEIDNKIIKKKKGIFIDTSK